MVRFNDNPVVLAQNETKERNNFIKPIIGSLISGHREENENFPRLTVNPITKISKTDKTI